jgi:HAE1 family hydrophobic/amphiphilic exporter-1
VGLVNWMAGHLLVSLVSIVGLFALLAQLFSSVSSSFIPEEDKGFFMVDVQLPAAASLNRTAEYLNQLHRVMADDPAIENILAVNGYSILNTALQSNAGMLIVKLKPWHERKDPAQHQFALQKKYQGLFSQLRGGRSLVFGAPAIPGLGAVAGFSYVLQDTQSRGAETLSGMLGTVLAGANQRPEITRAFSTFRADYPQIWLEVDRVRAKTLGVAVNDIFLALQTNLGGYYVNDFNLFGKTYKVMVQAEAPFRQQEEDLAELYVNNNKGELVSMSALVTTVPVQGADVLYRYNTYDSATVNGQPDALAGFSSGDAMLAMENLSSDFLGPGFKFDWTDSSYEERKSGNLAPIALAMSLLFTYLFLVALYESFMTPFAIILSVPIAMIGALAGLLIMGEPLSLYGQIGMVLLVGMASKTAILIVEFGKSLRERDAMSLHEATVESARLRFRPVMMTALAFVVGVFPLVIASGAGAASRVSLGLSIFGGTIMACIGGTILVPIFFRLIQGMRERAHGGKTEAPE